MLFGMLAIVLLSVIAGVFLTFLLQWLWVRWRFGRLPVLSTPIKSQTDTFQLPKELLLLLKDPDLKSKKESCVFLNLLFQFLFRELKDTQLIRRWVARKMNAEFTELLQTTSGKLLDRISVRDFNFGSTFPVLHHASVKHSKMSEDEQSIEELDVAVDIEYRGGFHLAVDVDVVFGRSAYLSVTIVELKGCMRLQLNRNPFTHWSLSFYEDPTIEFNVESRLEGHPIPQITSLIVNQIRRSIKKKHTLPNYKMRFKPFFLPQEVFLPSRDLYFRGNRIGVGGLEVTVIECSRLLRQPNDSLLYCTLSLGRLPWFELARIRKTFVTHDIEIKRFPGQPTGLQFKEDFLLVRYETVIVIEAISLDGPAANVDLRKNDILVAVGGQKVTSQKQAARLLKNAGERFTIRIERAVTKDIDTADVKFEEDFISSKDTDDVSKDSSEKGQEDFVNISVKSVNGEAKSLQGSPTMEKSPQKRSSVVAMLRRRTKSNVGDSSTWESPQSSPEPRRRNFTSASETKEMVKDFLSRSPLTSPKKQQFLRADNTSSQGDLSPSGKRKLSTSSLEDGAVCEAESESDSEEEQDVKKTSYIPACRDPLWNERFKFEVEEDQKYLNVCVRCKIPEKQDRNEKHVRHKDMLLGYVSLSICDVALDCLMTLQGDSQRTVHLSPEETKAGASRAKLPNLGSHPGFDPNLCYGDITLGFFHTPYKPVMDERKRLTKHPSSQILTASDLSEKNKIPGDGSKRLMEGSHDFVITQFNTATYCHFCGKKIWLKTAFQCHSCEMICHKKCTEKCQAQTLCRKDGVRRRSRPDVLYKAPVTETDKRKFGDEGLPKSGGILSKFRKDPTRRGKPSEGSPVLGRKVMSGNQIKVEQSPFFIKRRNSAPDDNDSDGNASSGGLLSVGRIPHTRSTTSLQNLLLQNASPVLPTEGFKNGIEQEDSSSEEGELTMSQTAVIEAIRPSGPGHHVDEMVVTAAKQMGRELYAHLTLEERKKKLDALVSKFQQEIDVESEHRAELGKAEQESLDAHQKKILQRKIVKADEKIQALMVLMLHYCAGLQHCMDLEEEKRHKDLKMTDDQETRGDKSLDQLSNLSDLPLLQVTQDLDQMASQGDLQSSGELEVEIGESL